MSEEVDAQGGSKGHHVATEGVTRRILIVWAAYPFLMVKLVLELVLLVVVAIRGSNGRKS